MTIETASSFGGPFVLLPENLVQEWVKAMGESPDPEKGLYGQVCSTCSFMHEVEFGETRVLRIGEGPEDVFWVPKSDGGLLVQWIAADSEEGLIQFGEAVSEDETADERLEIEVRDSNLKILDSCGFEDDGQPKISLKLDPGRYEVKARYAEDESNMALVFTFRRTR